MRADFIIGWIVLILLIAWLTRRTIRQNQEIARLKIENAALKSHVKICETMISAKLKGRSGTGLEDVELQRDLERLERLIPKEPS